MAARNPYDRQLLAEHVLSRARTKGQVQVLIDNQRWVVHRRPGPRSVSCSRCGLVVDSACYLVAKEGIPYCVSCAFEDLPVHSEQLRSEAEQRAS